MNVVDAPVVEAGELLHYHDMDVDRPNDYYYWRGDEWQHKTGKIKTVKIQTTMAADVVDELQQYIDR